jgi:hypothetical protein
MKTRLLPLTIATACLVAISAVGLIVAVAQYFTVERQREAVEALSLTGSMFFASSAQLASGGGNASTPSLLKDYELNSVRLNQALSLSVSTLQQRQVLSVIAWTLALLISGMSLLLASSSRKQSLDSDPA